MSFCHAAMTFLLGLFSLGMQGCTLAGFVVGATSDSGNEETRLETVLDVDDLTPGDSVSLRTSDGSTSTGFLVAVSSLSFPEYQKQYAYWRTLCKESSFSPALRDTVTLVLKSPARGRAVGRFVGFTDRMVRLDQSDVRVRGTNQWSSAITEISLAQVDTIYDAKGSHIPGAVLQDGIGRGIILAKSYSLSVRMKEDTVWIPWQTVVDITRTRTDRPIKGRLIGSAIGLAVDAVIATIIAINQLRLGGMMR